MYTEHVLGSQVVMTAWAVIGLITADYPDVEKIKKGIKLIMGRQKDNGEWEQEAIEGVFNKNVAIAYPNFKFSFTIWMLGRAHKYLEELKNKAKSDGNGHTH